MRRAAAALASGHQLQLLQGGVELFSAMIDEIGRAQHEVMLETYIFDFVGAGAEVAIALLDAARRGVTVRLMVDGVAIEGRLAPLPPRPGVELEVEAFVEASVETPAR